MAEERWGRGVTAAMGFLVRETARHILELLGRPEKGAGIMGSYRSMSSPSCNKATRKRSSLDSIAKLGRALCSRFMHRSSRSCSPNEVVSGLTLSWRAQCQPRNPMQSSQGSLPCLILWITTWDPNSRLVPAQSLQNRNAGVRPQTSTSGPIISFRTIAVEAAEVIHQHEVYLSVCVWGGGEQ